MWPACGLLLAVSCVWAASVHSDFWHDSKVVRCTHEKLNMQKHIQTWISKNSSLNPGGHLGGYSVVNNITKLYKIEWIVGNELLFVCNSKVNNNTYYCVLDMNLRNESFGLLVCRVSLSEDTYCDNEFGLVASNNQVQEIKSGTGETVRFVRKIEGANGVPTDLVAGEHVSGQCYVKPPKGAVVLSIEWHLNGKVADCQGHKYPVAEYFGCPLNTSVPKSVNNMEYFCGANISFPSGTKLFSVTIWSPHVIPSIVMEDSSNNYYGYIVWGSNSSPTVTVDKIVKVWCWVRNITMGLYSSYTYKMEWFVGNFTKKTGTSVLENCSVSPRQNVTNCTKIGALGTAGKLYFNITVYDQRKVKKYSTYSYVILEVKNSEHDYKSTVGVTNYIETTPLAETQSEGSKDRICYSKLNGTIIGVALTIILNTVILVLYCRRKEVLCWRKEEHTSSAPRAGANMAANTEPVYSVPHKWLTKPSRKEPRVHYTGLDLPASKFWSPDDIAAPYAEIVGVLKPDNYDYAEINQHSEYEYVTAHGNSSHQQAATYLNTEHINSFRLPNDKHVYMNENEIGPGRPNKPQYPMSDINSDKPTYINTDDISCQTPSCDRPTYLNTDEIQMLGKEGPVYSNAGQSETVPKSNVDANAKYAVVLPKKKR